MNSTSNLDDNLTKNYFTSNYDLSHLILSSRHYLSRLYRAYFDQLWNACYISLTVHLWICYSHMSCEHTSVYRSSISCFKAKISAKMSRKPKPFILSLNVHLWRVDVQYMDQGLSIGINQIHTECEARGARYMTHKWHKWQNTQNAWCAAFWVVVYALGCLMLIGQIAV